MNIQINSGSLINTNPNVQSSETKQEEVATAFEEIFARQLVSEMTKGLFKHGDNMLLGAGSDLYRAHIVDTLSQELAKQHKLGIANMVMQFFNQRLDNNEDS